jgi:hypothetical protein
MSFFYTSKPKPPAFDSSSVNLDLILHQVEEWLQASKSEQIFVARTSFLNELCHRQLLPIFVKPVYHQLILDLLKWVDDPDHCSNQSGRRYKCLDGLVRYTQNDILLTPYAFLELTPLTLSAVHYCIQSCPYIYSLSRLVEFLAFLGCRTSRKRLITYNTVYPWPLAPIEPVFIERKAKFFEGLISGQSKFDRKNELSVLMVKFLEESGFREDFLNRLQSEQF